MGAIGAGMNYWQPLLEFVREPVTLTSVMLAGRWTLLDRSGDPLLKECLERGVAVVSAAPFNSGILSRARPNAEGHFNYDTVSPELLARAQAMAETCERYGVTLPEAAINFPLRHDAVVSVASCSYRGAGPHRCRVDGRDDSRCAVGRVRCDWRGVKRRYPRPSELAPLIRLKRPQLNAKQRRLSAALTIWDLREIAKRRTPRGPFDYTDGAADAEISLARARQAFEDIEFHPGILRDVSKVDTSSNVLGGPVALPFGIAPTGFTRMMHAEGEIAGAEAAAAAGIPFSLSTLGTTTIEDVKAANPNGRNWFQLYLWKDRDASMALVERAASANYDTLLVTVDVPVAGARLRDSRNGLTIPPQLTLGTVLNTLAKPAWWINFLTTDPLTFASLTHWSGTVGELLDATFDSTVTFEELVWIKQQWPGKLLVKGIAESG